MVPPSNLVLVDVRDVATSHLRAMTIPEAAGQRFVLWTENMWLKDFAGVCIQRVRHLSQNVNMGLGVRHSTH